MRRYTVYRMNYATREKEAIGCIVDRRRMGRETRQNSLALLVEARELFGKWTGDEISVELEFSIFKRAASEQGNARRIPVIA